MDLVWRGIVPNNQMVPQKTSETSSHGRLAQVLRSYALPLLINLEELCKRQPFIHEFDGNINFWDHWNKIVTEMI